MKINLQTYECVYGSARCAHRSYHAFKIWSGVVDKTPANRRNSRCSRKAYRWV